MPGIPDALHLDRDALDVLSLAGLAPPPEGDWLLVTSLESQPGGGFTAWRLHRHEPHARGGDVLVRVASDTGSPGQPEVRAQVWAVMGGRLVLAGSWDPPLPPFAAAGRPPRRRDGVCPSRPLSVRCGGCTLGLGGVVCSGFHGIGVSLRITSPLMVMPSASASS